MEPFIAEIMVWGCNFNPRSWAKCEGQLLPISSNTALFSLIGTTYGGDGRSTFGLPNLKGRYPMHTGGSSGTGPGLSPHRLGEMGGMETVTLTLSQIPSHNHPYYAGTEANDNSPVQNNTLPNQNAYGDTGDDTLNTKSVADAGGGQSHNNWSPFLTLNICIALQGLYPSRS